MRIVVAFAFCSLPLMLPWSRQPSRSRLAPWWFAPRSHHRFRTVRSLSERTASVSGTWYRVSSRTHPHWHLLGNRAFS
uniref:Putative secreted protein n=1 Tax=Anopheles darlingi TaxID=43151 RepID=A0A2M4DIB6_ANODA